MTQPTIMRAIKPAIALLLISLFVSSAAADTIAVTDAWLRATVAPQTTTGAFMTIKSDVPAKLIAASSPLTKNIQFHAMSMDGGVMRMRALPEVELKPNVPTTFNPGGLHIMLSDLKQPIKPGARVPVQLTFRVKGKEKTMAVEVLAARGEPQAHH